MAQDNFNYGTPLKGVNRRQGILDELKRNGYDVSFADPTPCLLYTSPSPRDRQKSRMPSSA